MKNLTAPFAGLAGEAGAYALDFRQGEGWALQTAFDVGDATKYLERTDGILPVTARRIRVEFGFNPGSDGVKGTIRVAVERKFRPEGFTLEVSQQVDAAGDSPVSTALDQEMVMAAIGSKCFAPGKAASGGEASDDMPKVAALLEGISVSFGPLGAAVQWQAPDGSVTSVHRDFSLAANPRVTVRKSG